MNKGSINGSYELKGIAKLILQLKAHLLLQITHYKNVFCIQALTWSFIFLFFYNTLSSLYKLLVFLLHIHLKHQTQNLPLIWKVEIFLILEWYQALWPSSTFSTKLYHFGLPLNIQRLNTYKYLNTQRPNSLITTSFGRKCFMKHWGLELIFTPFCSSWSKCSSLSRKILRLSEKDRTLQRQLNWGIKQKGI